MPAPPLRLIVNADDFGYTDGVNRAIIELHAARALSSATMMATGASLNDALAALSWGHGATGPLEVGCHVVLVDGTPVLSAGELPTLAPAPADSYAARGRRATPAMPSSAAHLRPTLGSFVSDLLRGRIREVEIEREAVAQIRVLQAHGIHVSHLDTHKHTHMFPRVLRPLLRAALQCGVRAIRNPFEPEWSLRATPHAPLVRRAQVRLLALLRPEFARLVAQAGLRTTAGAMGLLATGTLDAPALERLLRAALRQAASDTDATWELVCHPGYHDAALDAQPTRLLAAREIERAALGRIVPAVDGIVLTHFGELA